MCHLKKKSKSRGEQRLHPIWEVRGSSPSFTFNPSFLAAMHSGRIVVDGSSSWVPAVHVGDQVTVLGSWLWAGPAPAIGRHFGSKLADGRCFSLLLYLSNKSNRGHLYNVYEFRIVDILLPRILTTGESVDS